MTFGSYRYGQAVVEEDGPTLQPWYPRLCRLNLYFWLSFLLKTLSKTFMTRDISAENLYFFLLSSLSALYWWVTSAALNSPERYRCQNDFTKDGVPLPVHTHPAPPSLPSAKPSPLTLYSLSHPLISNHYYYHWHQNLYQWQPTPLLHTSHPRESFTWSWDSWCWQNAETTVNTITRSLTP